MIMERHGKLSDSEIDEKMSNGVAVTEHDLINMLNQTKFFDSEPPVYYTMIILWDHIFKNLLDETDFRILSKNKIVWKTISVDDIFKIVQKFAPLSEENTVKKKWITKALKKFVEIKIAKFIQNESFEIKIKRRKDETIAWIPKEIKKIPILKRI